MGCEWRSILKQENSIYHSQDIAASCMPVLFTGLPVGGYWATTIKYDIGLQ